MIRTPPRSTRTDTLCPSRGSSDLWEIGLAAPGSRYADGDTRFGFVIAPQASDAKRSGRIVPPDFWAGSAAPECTASGFRYASVPGNAKPETVLQRLAALR